MFDYLEKNWKKTIFIIFAAYWIVLLTATSLPGSDLPDLGVSDKLEHFSAYLIFSFMLCIVLMFQDKYRLLKRRALPTTILFISVYAAFDELHQLFIPGRSCDIIDWSADFTSACLAVSVVYVLSKINLKKIN